MDRPASDFHAALLRELFDRVVAAAHPRNCLVGHLPEAPRGRIMLLAAGKAAGAMTEVAERYYRETVGLAAGRLTGLAVTRRGYARPTAAIPVIEAGHPVPDAKGLAAAHETLALADGAGADDLALVLLSGGASANWVAPVAGVSLAEKQAVTRSLLACSATIAEINTVRKHLSLIKGGRLARRACPARVVTLAVSDVPGDDPATIGSGPTVPDPSTLADARAVLARHRLRPGISIASALGDPANESPKAGDPAFAAASFTLVARPADALAAVDGPIRAAGFEPVLLGERVEGEAREVAAAHARQALDLQRQGRRIVLVSGGELTVTVRGSGRGGPNQEYALALAIALGGAPGIAAFAADTDGTDGGSGAPDDPAGAPIDPTTLARARAHGLDPAASLAANDSSEFFGRLGDTIVPGPTFTNVNDFRAILIDSP